jgi:cutinase
VFARGTDEPPGIGEEGQAFVDSLRSHAAGKSVGEYAVNYPASWDFPKGLDGINDAGTHIEQMAANCPATKMVLGGYSQGAAVMGFVTSNVIPDGAPAGVPNPMPPEIANHVSAVALMAKPSNRFMSMINQPRITIGPLYAGKTIELCAPADLVCSDGGNWAAHTEYKHGYADQAAAFAASRL